MKFHKSKVKFTSDSGNLGNFSNNPETFLINYNCVFHNICSAVSAKFPNELYLRIIPVFLPYLICETSFALIMSFTFRHVPFRTLFIIILLT